jgi:hypothetical protein
MPPAPGCQCGPEPCSRRPGSSVQVPPPSTDRNSAASSTPASTGVRIGRRRRQVPHPRELPGVRRAVVPLVGARHVRVGELVADRRPGAPAVVGALDLLAEPAARLRRPRSGRDRPATRPRGRSPSRRRTARPPSSPGASRPPSGRTRPCACPRALVPRSSDLLGCGPPGRTPRGPRTHRSAGTGFTGAVSDLSLRPRRPGPLTAARPRLRAEAGRRGRAARRGRRRRGVRARAGRVDRRGRDPRPHLARPRRPRGAHHPSARRSRPAGAGGVRHAVPGPAQPGRPAPRPDRLRGGRRDRGRALEALDGTPVLDVKPVLHGER